MASRDNENTNYKDGLIHSVRNVSIDDETPPKNRNNRRRAVNSHLYANKPVQKGRIPQDQNNDFKPQEGEERGINKKYEFQNTDSYTQSSSVNKLNRDAQHWQTDKHSKSPAKKNTETFKPSYKPTDMRILCCPPGCRLYPREIQSRDLLICNDLFCQPNDLTIYNKLISETESTGIKSVDLWQLWHGDSHMIANDRKKWKDLCPTFKMVLDKIQEFFQMDIQATRLNWYRDSNEWKPFHHDAAAIKADKAETQNLTVAVSFGAERDSAFEHAKTKSVISLPQINGSTYTFAKDVNIIWRHGILQVPPESYHNRGRISIIAWGWVDGMLDC